MVGPGSLPVRLRVIVGAATALGIFSTFQAYNYVSLFTEREPSFPMLLALNVTYWYAWAVLVLQLWFNGDTSSSCGMGPG